jgi:hypothetical protein
MEKIILPPIKEIYRKVESSNLIESTIKEVQWILWFKKIIAFTGWWQQIKIIFEDTNIQEKIKEQSNQIKEKIVRDIISRLKNYDVAILTWWTNWDIPKIATKIAREYNLPTIWILPKRWEKDSLWKSNLLNIEIIINSEYWDSQYWDESAIFAKLSDWMFVIWWWAWTLIEFAHFMKINESLKKYNWYVKKIVPINWIWWLSEILHHIPWNDEIKELSLPKTTIYSWEEAFQWLKNELDLNNIIKKDCQNI